MHLVVALILMLLSALPAAAMPLDRTAHTQSSGKKFFALHGSANKGQAQFRPSSPTGHFISLASVKSQQPIAREFGLRDKQVQRNRNPYATLESDILAAETASLTSNEINAPTLTLAEREKTTRAKPPVQLAKLNLGEHFRKRQPRSDSKHIWPVDEAVAQRISSPFGYRIHPITHRRSFHKGIDIAAAIGTKVVATADGQISETGTHRNLGRYVKLAFEDGTYAYYGHLSGIKVRTGQKVKQGESIGQIGSTGRSTGPHLDYSLRINGKAVDPLPYLPEPPAIRVASVK
jgi:murein DD-endopeptidase MepM/ murein hydrolase activator NlpD